MKNRHNLLKIISLVFMGMTTLTGCDLFGHKHVFSDLVAQKDATCTETGLKAHYTCSECQAYFDQNQTETTLEDLIIPALGHNMEHHDAADGIDCQHNGTIEYYACSRCHKNFKDANGVTEVTDLDNHTCGKHSPVEHAAVSASNCSETGTIKYYECSVCHKNFSDEACTTEISNTSDGVYGPHNLGELIPEVPATHTTEGTKAHYDCSICQKHFADANAETELTDLTIECEKHTFDQKVATSEYCVTEETIKSEGTYYYSCECGAKGTETFTVPALTVNKNWELKDGVYSNKANNAITSVSGISGTEDGFTYSGDVEVTRMEGDASAQTRVSLVFFATLGDETKTWEDLAYEYYCFYFNFQSGATSIAHVAQVDVEGVPTNKWNQVSVVSKAKLPSAVSTKYDAWIAAEAGTKATFNFEIVFDGEALVTFIDGEKISQCDDLLTNAKLVAPVKTLGTTLGVRSEIANTTAFSNIKCSSSYGPTLTLNANGGEISGSTTKKLTKGIATTLPEATKEGSSFKGWATSASGEVVYNTTDSYTFTEDVELFAIFANTYTLSYSSNVYGTTTKLPDDKEVPITYKATSEDLPTLVNPYYVFDGWYNGSTKVEVGYAFTDSTTLTAKFSMREGYTDVTLKKQTTASGGKITNCSIGSIFELSGPNYMIMNESFSKGTIEFAYTTPTSSSECNTGIVFRSANVEAPTGGSALFTAKYNGLFLQLPTVGKQMIKLFGPTSTAMIYKNLAAEDNVENVTTYWVKIVVEEYQTEGETPVKALRVTVSFNDKVVATFQDTAKMIEGGTIYADGTGLALRRNAKATTCTSIIFSGLQFKAA